MKTSAFDNGNSGDESIIAPLDEDHLQKYFTLPGTTLGTSGPQDSEQIGFGTTRADVTERPKPVDPLAELGIDTTFSNPGIGFTIMNSRQIIARNLDLSVEDESFNKTAWIMEHGESRCASCDAYYIPQSVEHARLSHCGEPGCPDLKGDLTEGDVVEAHDGKPHVVKTMSTASTRLVSTEDYLEFLEDKTANSTDLYYKGVEDRRRGRELDIDLAEKADTYLQGFDDAEVYEEPNARRSAPQRLVDIKPNSNMLPHPQSSLPFPNDVIEKFFNED